MDENQQLRSERAQLFNPSSNIDLLFCLDKSFTYEQLAMAAQKMVTKYHFLNRVIDIDSKHEVRFRQMHFMLPYIEMVEKKNSETFKKIISEEERIPFDLHNGSMLRIIAIQDAFSCDLLLIMHHLLGDSKSAFKIGTSFLQFLDDNSFVEQGEVEDSLITCQDTKFSFLRNQLIKRLNKRWKKEHVYYNFDDYRQLFVHYYNRHQTKINICHFDEQTTLAIINYCHKLSVSVNSFVTTIFLYSESLNENIDTKAFHMCGVSVDLRKHFNTHKQIVGNYSSVVKFEYKYNGRLSFDKNCQNVHRIIYERIQKDVWEELHFKEMLDGTLIDAVYCNGDVERCLKSIDKLKRNMYDVKHRMGMYITNIGYNSIELKNFSLKKVALMPAVLACSEKMLGIVSVNKALSITMQFNVLNTNRCDMMNVFEGAILKIKDVVGVANYEAE